MTAITVIPAIAMWAAAIVRLPAALHQPKSRPFTVAVAVFAAAATLRIPEIAQLLQGESGSTTAAETAKDALAVLGATSLRGIVATAQPLSVHERARRHRLTGAAVLALVLLAAFTRSASHGIDYTGPTTGAETVWVVTYWAIFLTSIGLSLLGMARGAWTAARSTDQRTKTTAYLALAAGCGFGLLWVADMAVLLAVNRTAHDPGVPQALYRPLILLALALVAVSAIAPVPELLSVRWRREWSPSARVRAAAEAAATDARTAAMRRLWRALAVATPTITLDPDTGDRCSLRPASPYRLLIEIRDGILAIRPYITPAMRADAERACSATGYHGEQDQLVRAAIQLDLGRQSKMRGASSGTDAALETGEGDTIADDADALGAFALAWDAPATQRLIAEAAATLTTGIK